MRMRTILIDFFNYIIEKKIWNAPCILNLLPLPQHYLCYQRSKAWWRYMLQNFRTLKWYSILVNPFQWCQSTSFLAFISLFKPQSKVRAPPRLHKSPSCFITLVKSVPLLFFHSFWLVHQIICIILVLGVDFGHHKNYFYASE